MSHMDLGEWLRAVGVAAFPPLQINSSRSTGGPALTTKGCTTSNSER